MLEQVVLSLQGEEKSRVILGIQEFANGSPKTARETLNSLEQWYLDSHVSHGVRHVVGLLRAFFSLERDKRALRSFINESPYFGK